eukprot:CAMPEP_0203856314 /NCGR_PEP_ID=MMETSP0359-20131031/10105_1 /ASSEMBLY_ACC=CAM_ASM_000338 /TAXON_ID=268821 /ORGANISM="Scrippsiella Hangoei, Strain SHTV-5" /LENGTH=82 /DNA_ID=CAMNT_0050772907 /DNA_START=95 /DNA_END=343 /DNA_ORIENTATION=+
MVEFVKTWEEGKKASPDVLAHSYALFKQATVGDAPAQAPEDESKKAKYEDWLEHKGMPKEKAMTEYISFIEASTKLYGRAGA